jgi:hypothetical protein
MDYINRHNALFGDGRSFRLGSVSSRRQRGYFIGPFVLGIAAGGFILWGFIMWGLIYTAMIIF